MAIVNDYGRSLHAARWKHLLAGLLYALLTVAAFPPMGVWPLALVMLGPLVWSAHHPGRRPWVSALMVSLGALPLWVFQERWLIDVTEIGYPLLAIYLSAYPGLFVWMIASIRRRLRPGTLPSAVVVPICWVALEFFRGEIALTGYAWFLTGHPLIESSFLAAPASLFGVSFVSFLVAALAGALADANGWSGSPRWVGGASAGVVVLVWILTGWIGLAPLPADHAQFVRVGLIQTNLPQNNKMYWSPEQKARDFEQFVKLTRDAAAQRPKPDLICWPETMFPGFALNDEFRDELARLAVLRGVDPATLRELAFCRRLEDLQRDIGVPMLVGAQAVLGFQIHPDADPPSTSSAAPANRAGILDARRPRRARDDPGARPPLGGVIPYAWRWPAAERWVESVGAGGMKFDLAMGHELRALPFTTPAGGVAASGSAARSDTPATGVPVTLVTPICFEATKARHCRAMAARAWLDHPDKPLLIANLSNDGWFGSWTGGREQHLQAARWRCVELAVPMIRAVNTGITCCVDQRGNVRRSGADGRELDIRSEGFLVDLVRLSPPGPQTLYSRVGELFGWTVLAAAGLLVLFAGWLGRLLRSNRTTAAA